MTQPTDMFKTFIQAAVVAALLCAAGASSAAQSLTGAGASFPAPLYAQWAQAYRQASGTKINYQSVGSGAGIRHIGAKMVAFGATDAPLDDAALAGAGLIQFPTVIGGVVPVVHVAGVAPGALKLSDQVLGDIFLGTIKRWNDAAITGLNPGLSLPDAPIAVVHRADGSGTSFLFTRYLARGNAEWKTRVGEGKIVQWPTGVGGKGNEGVSALVQHLPNAIGYVEFANAKLSNLAYVQLRNRAGNFVSPDDANFKAAADSATWARNLNQIMAEPLGQSGWPITGVTFVLMHQVQDRPADAASVLRFFDWTYAHGDKMAEDLEYMPLPDTAKDLVRKLWADKLRDRSGQAIPLR